MLGLKSDPGWHVMVLLASVATTMLEIAAETESHSRFLTGELAADDWYDRIMRTPAVAVQFPGELDAAGPEHVGLVVDVLGAEEPDKMLSGMLVLEAWSRREPAACAEAIPALIETLIELPLCTPTATTLGRMAEDAGETVAEWLHNEGDALRGAALAAAGAAGTTDVADALIEHYDSLMRLHSDNTVTAIRETAPRGMIDVLRAEMRPGARIAPLLVHLCDIHGEDVPELAEARASVKHEHEIAIQALMMVRKGEDGKLPPPASQLELALECIKCGRTHLWDVGRAYVWMTLSSLSDPLGCMFSRRFQCPHCGAFDTYVLGAGARPALMIHTLAGCRTDAAPAGLAQKLRLDSSEMFGGGTPEERYWTIEEFIAEVPGNEELHYSMGLYGMCCREYEGAAERFESVLELDQDDPLAMAGLGFCRYRQGRDEEALGWYRKALAGAELYMANDAAGRADVQRFLPAAFTGRLRRAIKGIEAGDDPGIIPLDLPDDSAEAPSFEAEKEEPGSDDRPDMSAFRNARRNDPCPCGSGKKFKRCCLRKVAMMSDGDGIG